MEELGFQSLDRRDGTLLHGCPLGSAGPLCTLGDRHPGSCRISDCHLVEELGF
jgi:hypothetical protein